MPAFFDNLTAVFVGTTLLVAMLFVQQRGQHGAVEATVRYRTQKVTAEFMHTLERDVENMRTMHDMGLEFEGSREVRVRRASATGGSYTLQFAFPTLLDPEDETPSEVVYVVYHVAPTGRQVVVNGALAPTYRAARYVLAPGATAAQPAGGSAELLDFDVTAFDRDGDEVIAERIIETPARIHLAVVAATEVPGRRAGDQEARLATTTRLARTVEVSSAAVPTADDDEGSGQLPALPGDPITS